MFNVVNELLRDCLGKVNNLVIVYSMIATKVLGMTLDENDEKLLGTEVFVNLI